MMFRISCRWQTVASLLASLMQVLWLIACTVSLAPTSTPAETATLMVGKLVDRQQASPGDVLTYTLVVMNDQLRGDDPGRRVQLVDRLPAALELVADSLQVDAAYDAQAHAIRQSGQVPRGLSVDVVFQARLTAASADMPSVVNAVAVTDAFGMERSSSAETQVIGLMNTVPPVLRSGATAAWSPQIEAHNIELVGYLGSSPVEVLAVQGNRAYVGAGNELSVIDVSDPANPAALRRYDSPGPEVRSMAVLEGRLFMTTGDGLMTLDMSDPSVSLMGGFYSLDRISRTSRDVAVQGHYAYVAAGCDGLQVVDSSDATNPRVVSAFDTPGHAWAIALRDGLAYIADENHGLRVIDVQDPLHRFEIGWHDVPGPYEFSQGVAVEGRYAYITDGQGLEPGLRIFDIAEPTSPTELANLLLDAPGDGAVLPRAEDVDVSEGYAYLAAGTAGLRVVDVADPTRPVEICTYKTPGRSHSLTVSGQFVYLTDGDLRVLGVSNHAAVEEVGFYDLPGSAQAPSVAVQGSPAVVTGQGSVIFDITTPSLPMVVAAHPLPYGRVAMDGERVCVVNGGLFVLRFSPS